MNWIFIGEKLGAIVFPALRGGWGGFCYLTEE
jgi:hypothetical protein